MKTREIAIDVITLDFSKQASWVCICQPHHRQKPKLRLVLAQMMVFTLVLHMKVDMQPGMCKDSVLTSQDFLQHLNMWLDPQALRVNHQISSYRNKSIKVKISLKEKKKTHHKPVLTQFSFRELLSLLQGKSALKMSKHLIYLFIWSKMTFHLEMSVNF